MVTKNIILINRLKYNITKGFYTLMSEDANVELDDPAESSDNTKKTRDKSR